MARPPEEQSVEDLYVQITREQWKAYMSRPPEEQWKALGQTTRRAVEGLYGQTTRRAVRGRSICPDHQRAVEGLYVQTTRRAVEGLRPDHQKSSGRPIWPDHQKSSQWKIYMSRPPENSGRPICPDHQKSSGRPIWSDHQKSFFKNNNHNYSIFGLPLTPEGTPCPLCHHNMDAWGHHMLTCHSGGDVITRHNQLRDCIADFCHKAAFPHILRKEVALILFPKINQDKQTF